MRELSCHAIEFQGWTHPEKLFQLVPARSGLWTRSSCKVPILWRIPQYSPKKLNLNESMSIYLLAQYPSIQSKESKNIQQVLGLQRKRLSKLHRTSSTIRRIFTYQGLQQIVSTWEYLSNMAYMSDCWFIMGGYLQKPPFKYNCKAALSHNFLATINWIYSGPWQGRIFKYSKHPLNGWFFKI